MGRCGAYPDRLSLEWERKIALQNAEYDSGATKYGPD